MISKYEFYKAAAFNALIIKGEISISSFRKGIGEAEFLAQKMIEAEEKEPKNIPDRIRGDLFISEQRNGGYIADTNKNATVTGTYKSFWQKLFNFR
jgi:hypothetical protein